MTRTLRRTAALALVLPLLATGCGDDTKSKNDYVDQVNRIQTQFATTYQSVAGQVTSTSPAGEDGETFKSLVGAIDGMVTQLRAVDPPESVTRQHEKLIDVLDGYGDDLSSATKALASGDAASVARARAALAKDTAGLSADFMRTISEINTKLRG